MNSTIFNTPRSTQDPPKIPSRSTQDPLKIHHDPLKIHHDPPRSTRTQEAWGSNPAAASHASAPDAAIRPGRRLRMGLFFSAFMQEHLLEFCRLSKKLNRVFEDILLFYVVFLFIVLVFQIFKDIQRYSRIYKPVPIRLPALANHLTFLKIQSPTL